MSEVPVAMHGYAQTNLQLYNQMLAGKYSVDDLHMMRRCHDLGTHLFSGQYRAHGKPFLAHLIGTASILAANGAPAHVVAAGLLHAVYKHGDFGMQWPRSRRRARVRHATSTMVEDLAMRYDQLEWTGTTLAQLHDETRASEPALRDVILIRLANELEDSLDNGLLYCITPYEGQLLTTDEGRLLPALASELGYPDLGTALAQAGEAYRTSRPPPDVLRVPTTEAFTRISPSYGLRPEVRLGRWIFSRIRPALDRVYPLVSKRIRA